MLKQFHKNCRSENYAWIPHEGLQRGGGVI